MSSTLPVVDGVTDVNGATLNQFEVAARKGAANGYAPLDSGGKLPDAQLPARIAAIGSLVPGNDCNNAAENGWFHCTPTSANRPPIGDYFAIEVANITTSTHARQVAYAFSSDDVFMRRMNSGVWGAWVHSYPASGGGVDFIGAWSAPTAYKKGDVVSYNGNDYMAVNDSTGVTPPAVSSPVIQGASIATTLPASPFDGQEAILVDSLTAPTYHWRMRWLAGASKWIYLGGSPMYAEVATQEGTASSTYVDLATVGPSLTLPRAGDYDITIGAFIQLGGNLSGWMSYSIGGTAAAAADQMGSYSSAATNAAQNMRLRRKTGLAAVTLTAKYMSGTGASIFFERRWMSAEPKALT